MERPLHHYHSGVVSRPAGADGDGIAASLGMLTAAAASLLLWATIITAALTLF